MQKNTGEMQEDIWSKETECGNALTGFPLQGLVQA